MRGQGNQFALEQRRNLHQQKRDSLAPNSSSVSNVTSKGLLLTSDATNTERVNQRSSAQLKDAEFDLRRPEDFEREKSNLINPNAVASPPSLGLRQSGNRQRSLTGNYKNNIREQLNLLARHSGRITDSNGSI